MINVTPRSFIGYCVPFYYMNKPLRFHEFFQKVKFFNIAHFFCESNPSNFTNLNFQRLESNVIAYLLKTLSQRAYGEILFYRYFSVI